MFPVEPSWDSQARCSSALFSCWLAAILLLQESKSSEPCSPYAHTNTTHICVHKLFQGYPHLHCKDCAVAPCASVVFICVHTRVFVSACVSQSQWDGELVKISSHDRSVGQTNHGMPLVCFRLSTTKVSACKPACHSQVSRFKSLVWVNAGRKTLSQCQNSVEHGTYPCCTAVELLKGQK